MLWRVRADLPDRPGTLAGLAAACGASGVDIKQVQIFPEHDRVTDDLVLSTPQDWGPEEIEGLVAGAGGTEISVMRCGTAALDDQPTRYVNAVRSIIAQPASFPDVAAHLFDADVAVTGGELDVLEMSVGPAATIQIRRTPPFTAVERARAEALAELVREVLHVRTPPVPMTGAIDGDPEFVTEGGAISALVSGLVTGRATVEVLGHAADPWPVDLWVDPAWHRRGIGTRLLSGIARVARAHGAEEIVLTAPSDSQAVLPMVLAAGMRGRIRMAGESLTVRIAVTELRV
ncbi:GNAT family N-acetyltransferase [Nocardioides sp. GY 10113]|uniref:GNAT family N-acetyltransferase n=1 Tax=Nocardioides sp. GY 10113 TaxID=2569761 RepID=UPI0010A87A19|nr:GNAT family N-acetyltransferase [Nocardioides sp. GY 10113]TIC83278.1 GNAT family N-acetyltransferase [Nocardioides sp. GY 10113]